LVSHIVLLRSYRGRYYTKKLLVGHLQGITLDILLCHDGEHSWMPNAAPQPRPKAEAKRKL
jgi:hypothetical protein